MHKWMGTEIQEGRVGDKRGRWAVEELLQVRRPGGRGRRLEVEVQWKGGWQTSWKSVTQLTGDLRKRAREMESADFVTGDTATGAWEDRGGRAAKARPAGNGGRGMLGIEARGSRLATRMHIAIARFMRCRRRFCMPTVLVCGSLLGGLLLLLLLLVLSTRGV